MTPATRARLHAIFLLLSTCGTSRVVGPHRRTPAPDYINRSGEIGPEGIFVASEEQLAALLDAAPADDVATRTAAGLTECCGAPVGLGHYDFCDQAMPDAMTVDHDNEETP